MNEEVKQSIKRILTNTPLNREIKSVVIKSLSKTYSEQEIIETIEHLLDNFELLSKIDYESELSNSEVWYLCIASEEETRTYQALPNSGKAFLKLLLSQDGDNEPGHIRYDEALSIMKSQGFNEEELRFLWIKDITDVMSKTEDEVRVEWCYLTPEWEKTESYKEAGKESTEKALEKEAKWRLEEYEE